VTESVNIYRSHLSYILCSDVVLEGRPWWKNFENRSTFVKVIIKHQVAYFIGPQWRPNIQRRLDGRELYQARSKPDPDECTCSIYSVPCSALITTHDFLLLAKCIPANLCHNFGHVEDRKGRNSWNNFDSHSRLSTMVSYKHIRFPITCQKKPCLLFPRYYHLFINYELMWPWCDLE